MERKRGLLRAAGAAVLLGALSIGGGAREVSAAQLSEELSKERNCTTMLSIARDENCQGIGTECVRICLEPDNTVSETSVTLDHCWEQMKILSEQASGR